MRPIALFVLTAALLAPMAATAQTKLQQQVQRGLSEQGIDADTTQMEVSTLAALHFQLTGPNDPGEGDMRSREALISILRKAGVPFE